MNAATMKKGNMIGLAVIAGISMLLTGVVPAAAWADDNYMVIKGTDDVRVTGKVTDVKNDSFNVDTGSTVLEVDMSTLINRNNVEDLVVPGMEVLVEGSMEQSGLNKTVIKAREITLRDKD